MIQQRSSLWREFQIAMDDDYKRAARIARAGIKLHSDPKQKGIWRRALSHALYYQGEFGRALKEALRAVSGQSDQYEKTLSSIWVGAIHAQAGRYDEAFEWFRRAEEMGRAFVDDDYLWCHFFVARALAFKRTGRLDEAIIDWEGGIDFFKRLGQPWRAALYTNNVGYLMIELGRYDEARKRLNDAMLLLDRDPHEHTRALVCDSLGFLCTLTGDHVNAHRWLKEAAQSFEALGDKPQLGCALLHLSELQYRAGNVAVAHAHASRALRLSVGDANLRGKAKDQIERITEGAPRSEKTLA